MTVTKGKCGQSMRPLNQLTSKLLYMSSVTSTFPPACISVRMLKSRERRPAGFGISSSEAALAWAWARLVWMRALALSRRGLATDTSAKGVFDTTHHTSSLVPRITPEGLRNVQQYLSCSSCLDCWQTGLKGRHWKACLRGESGGRGRKSEEGQPLAAENI